MSQTIYEFLESLCIGRVEFVSPDEIKVLLDVEAPDSVALNAGSPRPFPRVHGYVLIPNDDGYIVGQIEWITVERSAFPKRKGVQDFGVVDLPFPLRRMSLNPLGTLRTLEPQSSLYEKSYGEETQTSVHFMEYEFRRGAEMLPTIGDQVLIPSELQLRSIVQSGQQTRLRIGASPLANDADVYVDPDRLFGRHLAVLGNTGSGKSCSVAGLIHWSLEAAASRLSALPNTNSTMEEGAASPQSDSSPPNARFIILDPNGEYAHAFSNDKSLSKARIFRVNPDINTGEKPLRVPIWFWNSAEWCAITQASSRTQRPALIQALRQVRDGLLDSSGDRGHQIRRFLRTIVATLHLEKNSGSPWASFPKPKSFYYKIDRWKTGIDSEIRWFSGEKGQTLKEFVDYIEELCIPRRVTNPKSYDFTRQEIDELISRASAAHTLFGGMSDNPEPPDVDVPRPFTGDDLLRSLEATMEMLNISDNVETLLIRVRALLNDSRLKHVIDGAADLTLEQWLKDYLGTDTDEEAHVTVVDLSLVPSDVVSIITSVIARLIFESLQRYVKSHPKNKPLPTVLMRK